MTNKLLPLLFGISVLALAFFAGWCGRDDRDIDVLNIPAEQARKSEMNTDSIRSAIEAEYRDSLQIYKKQVASRQTEGKIEYRYIRIKDEQLERDYEVGQTTAAAVISSKNIRIKKAETLLARCDSTGRLDSLTIVSQAGTIVRKDSTIVRLNEGWAEANLDNAKLQKKVARRNKWLKVSGAVIAVLAGVIAVK